MVMGGELPEVTVKDWKTSKAEVAETVVSSNRLARLKIDIDDMIDMEEEYKKKKKKNKQSAQLQNLTPTAARMKAIRDKRAAMTPIRRDKKAENQRICQRSDSDIHHKSDGSTERVSVKNNRGNFGNGTKNEG